MTEVSQEAVAKEVAARQESRAAEAEARNESDRAAYEALTAEADESPSEEPSDATEAEDEPDTDEAAPEGEAVEEADDDPDPASEVDPSELDKALKNLAFAKVDIENLDLTPGQTLAFGAAIGTQRKERDRLLHEMSKLRNDADPEPSSESTAEPGRPPAEDPPTPPPADLSSVIETLAEPLGLDADGAKQVGEVVDRIVAARTGQLEQQTAQMAQALELLVGRTLQSEVGERFPELKGNSEQAQRLMTLAASVQEQFDGDMERALDFAANGLGIGASNEPKPKKSKPRKVTSTPASSRARSGDKPATKAERDYAFYQQLVNKKS